ncbi:hypothetical protein [Oceaniglobus ichthyenteri]|uniref:hypothetical protein n=1 Tax=Oceaniglobus ichthyenteri TaxID=2136177 RepID=UPI000D33BE70|nr:hypothetical protein [Oceaniglobus ichthyenteri]
MTDDDSLTQRIATALATNPQRVQRLDHAGQTIWIKRRETPGLLLRLQKGNPDAAFKAERHALHEWHRMRAPAPKILAEGTDFLALADSGRPLNALLSDPQITTADRIEAFHAAGRALAALHARQISHGRPSLKDICWDGQKITFLDLERYAARRNTPQGHAMDLVMFVFNALVVGRGMTPELNAAIQTYRANDPDNIWGLARAWCHKMRWIDWITKPVQLRRGGKAKEFKAIPLTLAVFANG